MNPFRKGLLVGALVVIAGVTMLAAAGTGDNGRYQGLSREGPVIIVDTQTGDFIMQGHDGKPEGYRWADAWTEK